jgi:flagellar hook-basal body complex protein FliE
MPIVNFKPIDTAGLKVTKAPADAQSKVLEILEAQYKRPANPEDNEVAPQNLYAEVQVGGKTVAKLYNSGVSEMPNVLAGNIQKLVSDGVGPNLAQARAEQIAQALGGKIVRASTAQTQGQWEKRPATQWVVDTAAIQRDVMLQGMRASLQQSLAVTVDQSVLIQAQILGQTRS